MFLHRTQESASDPFIGDFQNGSLTFITYGECRKIVQSLAMALRGVGIGPDDKVSILSNTRKEWFLADMAILTARGVSIPIYQTYTHTEVHYIFNHSDSKVLFVENQEQMAKVVKVQDQLANLTHIISFDDLSDSDRDKIKSDIKVCTFGDFVKEGQKLAASEPEFFENNIKEQSGSEVASIIYTSGTTGEPKGAVITHSAFTAMLGNVAASIGSSLSKSDRTLTWLPLSHVFGRCESMLGLVFGWEMAFAQGIDHLVTNLGQAKPTALLAVPRIFEKIYAKIMDQIESSSPAKKKIFAWANRVSTRYYDLVAEDRSPTLVDIVQKEIAFKLVFKKIYDRFGGRIRWFISGGAPISIEIIKFLRNARLAIVEGYGLTETVAPCTLNPFSKQIPGTVGTPIGDVEIKMADDGEILIKSKALLQGYYKNPQATAEVLKDGWLYSGDIGEFTQEGYLRITDRKKDIIVTSGGKNVAPQKIENMLKLQNGISHSVVVGDRQKFLTALIGIERESYLDMVDKLGLASDFDVASLAANPKVHELIKSSVNAVNKQLPSFETIKSYYIIPEEFTVDNSFITPSLKVRKKNVIKAYQGEIDKMYGV